MEKNSIKERFRLLAPFLDEHMRRRFAAAEALAIGYGGVSIVSRETGLSRGAISLGCEEIKNPETVDKTRIRRKGGGRKQAIVKDPTLKQDLEQLIDPADEFERSPLRWTCKSVRTLASELNDMGHVISHNRIADLLHELGYTLRANQRTLMSASQDNREAQFFYVNERVKQFLLANDPVIFVDIRKRELVNQARLRERHVDDLEQQQLQAAIEDDAPSMFDEDGNPMAWMGVMIDEETAEFAATTLARWWQTMGCQRFIQSRRLLVVVEIGGSNDEGVHAWKQHLQHIAEAAKLSIAVSHLPPGTSKWQRTEHQIFAFTNQHHEEQPLTSHRTSVNLVMPPKAKVQLQPDGAILQAEPHYHEEWNYEVSSEKVEMSWPMLRGVANG